MSRTPEPSEIIFARNPAAAPLTSVNSWNINPEQIAASAHHSRVNKAHSNRRDARFHVPVVIGGFWIALVFLKGSMFAGAEQEGIAFAEPRQTHRYGAP